MTRDKNDMLDALAKPFPPQAIKQRRGSGGRMWDYVPGDLIIRRLNDATDGQWDFRIASMDWRNDLVVVVGELTIPGLGTRAGIGVQRVADNSGEDIIKGAQTDSLKKAATQFGVALDLYGPDVEAGEISKPRTTRDPILDAAVRNTPRTRQDAPGRAETRSPWSDAVRIAATHHVAEESLYEYFAARACDPPDVPGDILAKFTDWCVSHTTAQVQRHIRDVIAESAMPPSRPSPALLAEAAAEPAGMADDDYAQVVAEIDAELASDRAAFAAHHAS